MEVNKGLNSITIILSGKEEIEIFKEVLLSAETFYDEQEHLSEDYEKENEMIKELQDIL